MIFERGGCGTKAKILTENTTAADAYYFEHSGYCELCERPSVFVARHPYFRNALRCPHCNSVPRQRAIWRYLNLFAPHWRKLAVHESSPGWDRVSQRLTRECPNYVASQYDPTVNFGTVVSAPKALAKQYRSENLEAQTFEDESFDVVVTQDVFEHIFQPELAIKEIARTLKTGGVYVMTVPIVQKQKPSQRRAALSTSGDIVHLLEPQYHGNPMSKDGSLVTVDWGYDIVSFLHFHSGLAIMMLQLDNIDVGVRADLCEVIVGMKRPVPEM